MTNEAKANITGVLDVVLGRFHELAAKASGEDRQAYHGVACSLEKILRRAIAKRTLEEKETRNASAPQG
jgi:hypothetical protein